MPLYAFVDFGQNQLQLRWIMRWWVVALTIVIHFSKVVMTTICSGYRVSRILYSVLLHALSGSPISLPTLLICISLSVNVLTSSGVCLSSNVSKLVFPLIFNLAYLHIPVSKTQGAATLVTIILPLFRSIVQFISLSDVLIVVSLWVTLGFGILYHSV